MSEERLLYKGGPSQVVNYNIYVTCIFVFVFAMFGPGLWEKYFAHTRELARFTKHFIMLCKAFFVIPIFYALYKWLQIYNHRYELTTEKLTEEIGILSKKTDVLELYRVKDITFVQPFTLRMFGCGNIVLNTSDKTTPIVILHAINNPKPLLEVIRKNVEIMRTKKGVREID